MVDGACTTDALARCSMSAEPLIDRSLLFEGRARRAYSTDAIVCCPMLPM